MLLVGVPAARRVRILVLTCVRACVRVRCLAWLGRAGPRGVTHTHTHTKDTHTHTHTHTRVQHIHTHPRATHTYTQAAAAAGAALWRSGTAGVGRGGALAQGPCATPPRPQGQAPRRRRVDGRRAQGGGGHTTRGGWPPRGQRCHTRTSVAHGCPTAVGDRRAGSGLLRRRRWPRRGFEVRALTYGHTFHGHTSPVLCRRLTVSVSSLTKALNMALR